MKYKDGDQMVDHISVFQNIVNQLAGTDIKVDDELQDLLLLSSLSDNLEVLVVTLTNSTLNGKLVMLIIKDRIFNEEVRRKERCLIVTPNRSGDLVTESQRRSKTINFHNCQKS